MSTCEQRHYSYKFSRDLGVGGIPAPDPHETLTLQDQEAYNFSL